MQDILLVSFGAALGSNIRFIIFKRLEKINLSKDYCIFTINILSSFLLGVFSASISQISSYNYSYEVVLFFSIGFLGSLSTFSTFVYDIFELLLKLRFFRASKLFIISLAFGLFALGFGFLLGNQ